MIHRINVKLGGINTVPDARSVPFLADKSNPTIIIGADVIHPSPGVENKPSFTSMVGNIDPMFSRYVAISKVQKARQEIIDDAEEMTKVCFTNFSNSSFFFLLSALYCNLNTMRDYSILFVCISITRWRPA
jgi:hypothetical protein